MDLFSLTTAMKVYKGQQPAVTGVKLQPGYEHLDYTLYVIVKAVLETRAYVTVQTTTKV